MDNEVTELQTEAYPGLVLDINCQLRIQIIDEYDLLTRYQNSRQFPTHVFSLW
jgi:hypothetical protein